MTDTCYRVHSHANFVPADDEGDLAAPGVDEAGPAGVDGDVLAVSCAEADGGVVERLTGVLQDWEEKVGEMSITHRHAHTLTCLLE